MDPSRTITLDPAIAAGYEELARTTGHSRNQLIADALTDYLDRELADQARTLKGLTEAAHNDFASDESVEALFAQYGGPNRAALRTKNEQESLDL
ncbi:MAG TPA: ribbon-helix-helix protein, CopG family [Chloroflexota bacterium]|nr:ribbon-helix-helix protein, CopG family [Chloroflexota bacterium]